MDVKFDSSYEKFIEDCVKLETKNNVLVIGDSFGLDTYLTLKESYKNFNFLYIGGSGCYPFQEKFIYSFKRSDTTLNKSENICKQFTTNVLNDFSNIDYLILSSRHDKKEAIDRMIDVALKQQKKIIIFSASPVFESSVPLYLSKNFQELRYKLKNEKIKIPIKWKFFVNDDYLMNKIKNLKNFKYIDKIEIICPDFRKAYVAECFVANEKGEFLFLNYGHFSVEGITFFSQKYKNLNLFNFYIDI